MKRIIIILLALASMDANAQNQYRPGDALHMQQIPYKSFDVMEGSGLVWSLGNNEVTNDQYQVSFLNNKDASVNANIAKSEHGTCYFFNQNEDSLLLQGYYNQQTHIRFRDPELYLRFPILLGDSLSGFFYGQGDEVSGNFVRVFGHYFTAVIGEGMLVTSDNDSLPYTKLVHTVRNLSIMMDNKDSLLDVYGTEDEIPALGKAFMDSMFQADDAKLQLDIYRWYAPGYRYAILETMQGTAQNVDAPVFSTAFYCAPDNQANLYGDEENERIRESIENGTFKPYGGCEHDSGQNTEQPDIAITHLKATQNGNSINYEFNIDGQVPVKAGIYTQTGLIVKLADLGMQSKGFHQGRLTLDHVNCGLYVFSVFYGDKVESQTVAISPVN